MRFASPEYLYLLVLPILLLMLYIFSVWKVRRNVRHYGNPKMFWRLVQNYSHVRIHLKFLLVILALILLSLMLARPQYGMVKEVKQRTGIEVVISLDVSNSMLATDVSPNRLERSKQVVSHMVDRMRDDKIGLNVFAGEAYPQMPITSDISSVKLFLENISTGMVTLQGTSVASAIDLATHSFTKAKGVSKAIVIITDGEDHEAGVVEAAEAAKAEGLIVYVLGVGTPEGGLIPTSYGPLTDTNGQIVRTALNEIAAQEIAQAGGGAYFRIDDTNNAIQQLLSEFSKLQHAESNVTYSVYNEQFVAVGILVLLLLIIEYLLLETVHPWYRRFHIFE